MLKIWDAANFRRTLGGLCLILAPLVGVAAEMTFPTAPGNNWNASGWLAIATQHHAELVAASYLGILSAILFLPAFFALLHVVRGRGVVLAHIGVILALIGQSLHGLVFNGFVLLVADMGAPGLDSAAMTALLQKTLDDPAAAVIVLGLYFVGLGVFLLGLAVWRSGFGYRWTGPMLSISILIDFIPGNNEIVGNVSRVLLVIAATAIAYRMLAMPDAAWESGVERGAEHTGTAIPVQV